MGWWSDFRDDAIGVVTAPYTVVPDIATGGAVSEALGINKPVYETIAGAVEDVEEFIDDPFGQGAATQQALSLMEQSTQAGISALTEQQQQVEQMYGGYYGAGLEALGNLRSMVLGGDYEYTPSKLFEYQTKMGERAIRRQQAAKGMLGSTGTEQRLADLYTGLAGQETERQYLQTLGQVQVGAGAASRISAGAAGMAGGVGSLYQGQAARQQEIMQGLGGARSALYQTGGNMLMNLGMYIGGR